MLYAVGVWLVIQAVVVLPVAAQDTLPSAGQVEAPSKGGVVLNVHPSASESAKHLAVAVEPDGPGPAVTGAADVLGFPFIEGGSWSDVDWQVNGSQITGTLKRKNGTVEGMRVIGTLGRVGRLGGASVEWFDAPLRMPVS